jgi:hypothetical protein
MDTVIYEETQTTSYRLMLVGLITAIFLFAFWQTWLSAKDTFAALFLLIATPLGILAVWSFTQLRVQISPTELRFGSSLYRKRIPLDRVRVGAVEHIPALAGIGIHSFMGRWVFNARYGRGVNIEDGKRRYLIGSDQPERLQSALLQAVPKREAR